METKTITVGAATHEILKDYAASRKISLSGAIKDLLSSPKTVGEAKEIAVEMQRRTEVAAIPGSGRAEVKEQIQ